MMFGPREATQSLVHFVIVTNKKLNSILGTANLHCTMCDALLQLIAIFLFPETNRHETP